MAVVPNRPYCIVMILQPAVLAQVSQHVLNLAAEYISWNASHSSAVSFVHAAKDKCIEQQPDHM